MVWGRGGHIRDRRTIEQKIRKRSHFGIPWGVVRRKRRRVQQLVFGSTLLWGIIGTRCYQARNAMMRGLDFGARLLFHVFDRGHPLDFRWSLKLRFALILPQNATRSCSWSLVEACQVAGREDFCKMICSNLCYFATEELNETLTNNSRNSLQVQNHVPK